MSHEEDKKVIEPLVRLCRDLDVKLLIQVGAADGYEAHAVSEQMGCRAIAIEGNSHFHPVSPTLEFHHLVIGATNGMTTFYANSNHELSSTIPRGSNEDSIQLEQQRLDRFCSIRGVCPDALIIDTEGTTLDVLEGCGALLDGFKLVYAECQTTELRTGIRSVGEIDKLLVAHGMTQHRDLPSYWNGPKDNQGNYTWVRP